MNNTVGSREELPLILRARRHLVLKVASEEADVLVGSVLGDGYITKKGRIQIEQGEPQREYLWWKFEKLQRITSTNVCIARRIGSEGKETTSYRFWTKQYFRPWRDLFYPQGAKEIPEIITNILSPLALAVWYMDDGCLRTHSSIIFATEKFSTQSVENLRNAMKMRYNIDIVIRNNSRLYLGKIATRAFLEIVTPHIAPSMQYKLP